MNRAPSWAGCSTKEGHMIEELKRMLYELDEEDLYLLYVTALEMLRHKQGRE